MLGTGQCFSHGQLYVAFSRVRKEADIKVLIDERRMARNVVLQQILDKDELKEAMDLFASLPADDDDIPSTSTPTATTPNISTPIGSRRSRQEETPATPFSIATPTSSKSFTTPQQPIPPSLFPSSQSSAASSSRPSPSPSQTPTGKNTKSHWDNFKEGQEKTRKNLKRKNVDKDGNCFFHAAAYSMMVIFYLNFIIF